MVTFSVSLPRADSDQWLLSFRRNVVSSFRLWILLSFVVLSAVLVNVSSKTPFLDPLFQRLNSFANPPLLHWPFSVPFADLGNISTTSGSPNVSSIIQTTGNYSSAGNQAVATSSDGKKEVFDNTHVVGEVDRKNQAVATSSDGKKEVFGNTHVGEVADKPQNASSSNHGSESTQNSVLAYVSENKTEPAYPHSGDSKEIRKNFTDSSDKNRIPVTKSPATAVTKSLKNCDIFDGRWIKDETLPYYPPRSCPYIDKDFDCHLNGRPDNEFEKWRWQPNNCQIPRFNATDFLERLRGKKLVFVGDSLNRNMWESLVCLLRHGIEDKTRVYEISGKHEFKKKGFYAFRYEDYNSSVDFVSSPFLVKESSFKGQNGTIETLRLDLMDDTTSMYHDADVLIFNTGHWWTHEKTSRGEDYYQEGNHVHARMKVLEAFKRALSTWARWVDKNIKRSHTQVIFRGFSVTHFRGGPWNSGGQCNKETEPIYDDSHLEKYPSKMKVLEYVLKDMQTPVAYLNISKLTDYRKDAHPSIYRPDYESVQQEVHAQDCSHWCLPGVPDSWNELLYAALLKTGRGSWTWTD